MTAGRMSRRAACLAPIITVALLGTPAANGQGAPAPSSDDIVGRLVPVSPTRSVRGMTVAPGKEAAKPSIDLYINFEFDSAVLKNDGILVLQSLGAALKDPRLGSYRFEVAGHTDAVGTDEYNQRLSEARAKTVVEYLLRAFSLPTDRLAPVGYGKARLLDPSRPTDSVNRRVQIKNLGE